jgi:hypothetical protein
MVDLLPKLDLLLQPLFPMVSVPDDVGPDLPLRR